MLEIDGNGIVTDIYGNSSLGIREYAVRAQQGDIDIGRLVELLGSILPCSVRWLMIMSMNSIWFAVAVWSWPALETSPPR
ncbi:hypothetical protein JW859_02765 [bacterium]|nr:hypothetical protein [bacterium]